LNILETILSLNADLSIPDLYSQSWNWHLFTT